MKIKDQTNPNSDKNIPAKNTKIKDSFIHKWYPLFLIAAFLLLLFLAYSYDKTQKGEEASVKISANSMSEDTKSQSASSRKNVKSVKGSNKKKASSSQNLKENRSSSDLTGNKAGDLETVYHYAPYGVLGNTSGNVINGSFMCKQGHVIYYINTEDGNKVYQMTEDGTNASCLSSYGVTTLNAVGGFLYAMEEGASGRMLQFDAEGEADSKVLGTDQDIVINGDYIYSTDGNHIIKRSIYSGAGREIYDGEDIRALSIYGERIYFISKDAEGCLNSINLNGKDLREESSRPCDSYVAGEDGIYILSDQKVYGNGNWDSPVLDICADDINIFNGNLYFANANDNDCLYQISLENESMKKLSQNAVENICLVDGFIAYRCAQQHIYLLQIEN